MTLLAIIYICGHVYMSVGVCVYMHMCTYVYMYMRMYV